MRKGHLRSALMVVSEHQIHLLNPMYVEDEDDFSYEEFEQWEKVKDPFQCFVYQNSPPTYETDVDDEDLVKIISLSYDHEVEQN